MVRYGEIALKSRPVRAKFERLLVTNLRKMLVGMSCRIRKVRGRIFIETDNPRRTAEILSKVPGVVSCSPAVKTSADPKEISKTAVGLAKKRLLKSQGFAVRTRRQGSHDFTSREINEYVGAEILRTIEGVKVDLSNPDVEISIEIWGHEAFVFTDTVEGVGGFPVGSQGRVLCWFSGKRKDLEAAIRMLKKGCEVLLYAFESPSVVRMVKKLLRYHHRIEIFVFPSFRAKTLRAPPKLTPLTFRRMVVELGNLLAKRVNASALVFSDGVELLTSRGLEWIRLADEPSKLPVFRPLLGEELQKPGPKRLPRRPGAVRQVPEISNDFISELLNQVKTLCLRVPG